MSVSDTLINTLFDGRYRILRKLGSGGMASVYLAEDEELGRRVAIKILNERYANDELFIERFRREAKSAARLSHPNIVSIYDRGEAEGTYYIAMEVIEGRSLKELLVTRGPLLVDQAIDYTRQILAALRFAHRNGIIHRDIKPHNVLLGAEDRLKVTDFGIARAGASQMTEEGSIIGTAHYLSPEQARGGPVTASSDLYSVGVVLYEMLTGQVPFSGDTPIEIAMKHLNERPKPPSELRREVPEELDQIVLRALAKSPEERFRSADEFAIELERVSAGLPVSHETAEAATALLTGPAPAQPAGAATEVLPPRARGRTQPTRRPPPYGPEYGYEAPPRKRRSVVPWLFVLALLIAAGLAGWYVFTQIQEELAEAKPVAVPHVVSLKKTLAIAKIEEAGLEAQVERQPNVETPAGEVFEQDPDAGKRISKGETVTIFVSTGVPRTTVPEVVGLPFDEAIQALAENELRWEKKEVFSKRPVDVVVAQSPKAGEEVEEGSTVALKISKGEAPVPVPNVLGEDQAGAEAVLREAGFEVTAVTAPSDEPDGTVVGQTPDPGLKAPKGSTVQITVSEGPGTATVPDVVGQERQSAEDALEEAGFGVTVVEEQTADPTQEGLVVRQDPSGGVQAERGSTVTMVVGKFAPPAPEDAGGEGDTG